MTNLRSSRVLTASCGAHLIQDGLVALQYVLLPVLAQLFGLNYTQVGLLRALSNGAMTLLEIPAGMLSERFGEPRLLVFGLLCACGGYLGVAFADSFNLILLGFLVAGGGAAFQHSLASALIARSFDDAGRRSALGVYNACGDLGKLAFTGFFSLAIGIGMAWNLVVSLLCLLTFLFTVTLAWLLRHRSAITVKDEGQENSDGIESRWGIKQPRRFSWLCVTVFLDTLAQSVFLTFIAFLVLEKGADETLASLSVVLALCGGMVGKFVSGYLAVHYGDRKAFRMLQVLTVSGLAVVTLLPLVPALLILPIVGIAVQGSSTVTYGALSDFVHRRKQSRGYAIIYTLSSLSAVTGPVVFGGLADIYGVGLSLIALALLTSLTLISAGVLRESAPLVTV